VRVQHFQVERLIERSPRVPLAVTATGGNRNDITQLIPLIDAVPPIRGRRGRPRCRPRELLGRPRRRPGQVPPPVARSRDHPPRTAAGVSPTALAWASSDGSSNAASPGCTASNDCATATNIAPTSTSAYSHWACALICYRHLPSI
jgi:hypothetical protein